MDKKSPPLMSKDIFILNPFELNLDQREREKWIDSNSFYLVVDIYWEREGSLLLFLLLECEKETTPIPISINPLVQSRDLPIVIPKDL